MLDISKIYKSNNYGPFRILNYTHSKAISIQFIETGYKTTAQANDISVGNAKDRLAPTIFGIGFIGEGPHKANVNGKQTKVYVTWRNMLRRCYDAKYQAKYPTYADCTVAEEWHDFQVYAEWHIEHYIEGYELDKDCKIDGNRIYSPDTCNFIRPKDNQEKAHAKDYVFTSPEGKMVNVYNLAEFCRENGLHSAAMYLVAKGKRSHHKQWRAKNECL